ncbi:MAG: hypothetical protein JW934_07645 [Anaerolineae bacterium]|nr:hypothetical protein [Anaerolineae bacterium]
MNMQLQHSQYTVRRKVLQLVGASFHVYDPSEQVVMFSKMKAFKLKEDIRVYEGEAMQTELLSIQARQIMDVSATYDVTDVQTGEKVGALKRQGLKSILKDEWLILGAGDQPVGKIQEDSMLLALVRRFLVNLFPQTYNMTIGETSVGTMKQNINPFVTKIAIDFSPDTQGLLDKRLGIAAAILMCAVEGKQS